MNSKKVRSTIQKKEVNRNTIRSRTGNVKKKIRRWSKLLNLYGEIILKYKEQIKERSAE